MTKDDNLKSPQRPAGCRWAVRGLVLFSVIGAALWFAPQMVARSPLRNRLVAVLVPELDLQAEIGTVELGWLQPVALRDVVIDDASGRRVLKLASLSCNRTLASLLLRGVAGARFTIDQPHLTLVVRSDGSNLEDLLQPLLDASDDTSDPIEWTATVIHGVVDLNGPNGSTPGRLDHLQVICKQRPGEDVPFSLEGTATLNDPRNSARGGTVSIKLVCEPTTQPQDGLFARGRISCETRDLELKPLASILHRLAPKLDLTGTVPMDASARWDLASQSRELDIEMTGRLTDGSLGTSAFRNSERLQVRSVQFRGKASLRGDQLHVEQLHVDSELGTIEVAGAFFLPEVDQGALSLLVGDADYQIQVRADVAKLASQLPSTLQLLDGTTVTQGEAVLTLQSEPLEGSMRRWIGSVTTRDIQAEVAGQPVRWDRPLALSIDLTRNAKQQVTGRVAANSEFVNIEATGSLESVTLSARGDLKRLMADLRQIIDLGPSQLAGTFGIEMQLDREPEGRFRAKGNASLEDFSFTLPSLRPVREKKLTLELDAQGSGDVTKIRTLDRALLRMESAGDRLEVKLREPLAAINGETAWPLDVQLRGDLERWCARLQPWLPLAGWKVGGRLNTSVALSLTPDVITVEAATVKLNRWVASAEGVKLEEPKVELIASGVWNRELGTVVARQVTLTSATLALRADEATMTVPSASDHRPAAVQADVAVRCNLARLQRCFRTRSEPTERRYRGEFDGRIQVSHTGDGTSSDVDGVIKNFVVLQPVRTANRNGVAVHGLGQVGPVQPAGRKPSWRAVWSEPEVRLLGRGSYDARRDRLEVKQCEVHAQAIALSNVTGTIDRWSTHPQAQVAGQVQYDLAILGRLLQPMIGDDVVAKGRGRRSFDYRGPLPSNVTNASAKAWSSATGAGGIEWASLRAFGLTGGSGVLEAKLARGVAQGSTVTMSVGDGRLQITPRLDLNGRSATLVIAPGRVLDQLQMTPELCRTWLRYVAPVLADATRADGKFSIDLTRATIPLDKPTSSDVAGTLEIHAAQIRPGPLTDQIVGIAQQIDRLIQQKGNPLAFAPGSPTHLNIAPQRVAFAVRDRRVYHRGLTVQVGDVVVRTSGDVGFDQTLALIAEVPIQDRWVERNKLPRSLRGQSLKIPIRGTLSKPQVDRRVMQDLARQLVGSAAQGLIEDALNNGLKGGLDQLFRKSR